MGCSFSKSLKDLENDIWYEIFLYLPLNSIFKLRCVSKVWLSILSNPIFIKQWYKLNSSSLPYALAYTVILSETNQVIKTRFGYAYPDCRQIGFSFRVLNWVNTNFSENELRILGSSNGLLLYSAWLCDDDKDQPDRVAYYVCNPLTKIWVSLPQSPKKGLHFVTAFLCDECLPSSLSCTSYKVVRIPPFGRAYLFEIEIFSSDSGKWVTYGVSCPQAVTWNNSINSLITHNGVLYWNVEGKKVVVYDCYNNGGAAGNYQCRLIELPGEEELEVWDDFAFLKYGVYFNRSCGVSEGYIYHAFCDRSRMTLSVWVLEDDWRLLHKDIELQYSLTEMNQLFGCNYSGYQIKHVSLNPLDLNIVLLGYCDFIWAYNIQTRRSDRLCHPSFSPRSHSLESHNLFIPFVLKPSPTKLPPKSWID